MDDLREYNIKFVYDRDMSGGSEVEIKIQSPRKPLMRFWEEEEIGDEKYWKIESDTDICMIRQTFLCAILITTIKKGDGKD